MALLAGRHWVFRLLPLYQIRQRRIHAAAVGRNSGRWGECVRRKRDGTSEFPYVDLGNNLAVVMQDKNSWKDLCSDWLQIAVCKHESGAGNGTAAIVHTDL